MNIEELTTLCEKWQRLLRLQDWDIDLEIKRHFDFHQQGRCTVSQPLKNAYIEIRDEIDVPNGRAKAWHDTESVLLHELLHVAFDGVRSNQSESEILAEEIAVTGLTHALINLDRARK